MYHGIAARSAISKDSKSRMIERGDSLRKDFDDATSESLVANTTHSVFRDYHPSVPASIPAGYAVPKSKLRLFTESKRTPHASHYAALIDNRVCRPHSALEV